ncbi:uncharacterized protein LOC135476900 [Liolophura sinensis]|uniref:uncharacterized protein LOC135476900 n=1 Tax=Liolophura sinensis TaxID=3198878 RepID=UPI00315861CF
MDGSLDIRLPFVLLNGPIHYTPELTGLEYLNASWRVMRQDRREFLSGNMETPISPVSDGPDTYNPRLSQLMVNRHKNTKEWWSREQTCEDISRIPMPIISHRHLSTEHTVIGEGSFGIVAIRTMTGGKEVVTKSFEDDISSEDILTEARLLACLRDTGCVPTMFGVCYSSDFRISIVQEYCAAGVTLYDVLTDEVYGLSNDTWLTIIKQITRGLRDIHRKGVLLNDLKEDNVLVDSRSPNVRAVFIDFGLATFKQGRLYHISEEERQLCAHLAPEVLTGQPTRPSSDVYSLGRMLENISFECDLCGLCAIADGCLDCEPQRPSTDCLVDWVDRLDPLL